MKVITGVGAGPASVPRRPGGGSRGSTVLPAAVSHDSMLTMTVPRRDRAHRPARPRDHRVSAKPEWCSPWKLGICSTSPGDGFCLGLASQVKGHNETTFLAALWSPAPRMREYSA